MKHFSDFLTKFPEAKTLCYSKGDILQFTGDKYAKIFYVTKGLLRSYIIDEKGKDHILEFSPEGFYILDTEAYHNHTPTTLFIDAIEDSEVIVVPQDKISTKVLDAETLLNEYSELTERVGILQKRIILLISEPAKNRYLYFINKFPQAIHRIPLKMIASYLGITPEVLSKIRSEIARSE